MKLWSDFFDYVAPMVPGADDALMTLHIRNAAIEFCRDTMAAKYTFPLLTSIGQASYDISLAGSDYTPVMVDSIAWDERYLKPATVDFLNGNVLGWRSETGTPRAYISDEPYSTVMYPIPDDVYELSVTLSVMPSRDSIGIEDYIFDRYVEVIAHGAIARMAAIPQKPYFNQQVAQMAAMEFSRGKASARTEVYKSFTRVGTKVNLRKTY